MTGRKKDPGREYSSAWGAEKGGSRGQGRKTKASKGEELDVKRSISMPAYLDRWILSQKEDGEVYSHTIVRLLTHRRQGFQLPAPGIVAELNKQHTVAEIAEMFGSTKGAVFTSLRRGGYRVEKKEINREKKSKLPEADEIRRLEKQEGMSKAEIARKFGVTQGAVTHRLSRGKDQGNEG